MTVKQLIKAFEERHNTVDRKLAYLMAQREEFGSVMSESEIDALNDEIDAVSDSVNFYENVLFEIQTILGGA